MVLFQRVFQAGRLALTLSQSRITAFFIHCVICATWAAPSSTAGALGLVGITLPTEVVYELFIVPAVRKSGSCQATTAAGLVARRR